MIHLARQRINLTRLAAVIISGLILFSRNGWENGGIVDDVFLFIGLLLAGVATVGRGWCLLYIAGYKNNTLITKGPYSISRNPLYLFSLVGAIGVGFASELVTVAVLIFVGFALYYPMVIKKEERKLAALHGEMYKAYCRSTPKFLPSLSLLDEPAEYAVKPRVFKQGLLDTLWFVWIIALLELIESLHEFSIIPTFFKLY